MEASTTVQKLAGLFGPSDSEVERAVLEGAGTAAAVGGVASLPLQGTLLYRALQEGKAPTEFGDVGTLVRNVAGLDSASLPDKMRMFKGQPGLLPFLDYAALPDSSAKMMRVLTGGLAAPEQGLIVPNTDFDLDPRKMFLGVTRGQKFDVTPGVDEAGEVADDLAEASKMRQLWDRYQAWADEALTSPGDDIARKTKYSPSAVLHELGHLSRSRQMIPRGIWAAGLLGGAGAGLGTAAAISDNEHLQMAAPAIAAAPMVPTLIEEARATRGAGQMLGEMIEKGMADPSWMSRFKKLTRPAYGTYMLAAGVPALAAGLTAKKVHDARERSTAGDVVARLRDGFNALFGGAKNLADEVDEEL